jgi:Ca2+-binding RTX toxin-like protein
VFAGTNALDASDIHFAGGDFLVDFSAAATQPRSSYNLVGAWDDDGVEYDQGVVASIGLTSGTIEYGNAGDRGTATLVGLGPIALSGGLRFIARYKDAVVSIQTDADTFVDFQERGGRNTFTGGVQYDLFGVMDDVGVTYHVDGYGVGGMFRTSVDSVGDVSTFSAVDRIGGYYGDDTFIGGTGDDVFSTGAGNDYVDGGDGFDTVLYNRSEVTGVQVDLSAGTATGVWSGVAFTDTLVNVEFVRGSNFADVLTGSGGDDRLAGQNGDDLIDGGYGANLLSGGAGIDLIRMGGGEDAEASDGDADGASGILSDLNGDTIVQIGVEDRISVLNMALTDAQVRLNGHTLSIDGDNDGTFETLMTVYGPAFGGGGVLTGVAPVLTYVEGVTAPGTTDLYSGTQIRFVPTISQLTAIGEVVRLTAGTS